MIVIDGYNFAYKIPSFLERLYRRDAATVHPEMQELLSDYLNRHSGEKILIVWDGYPPGKKPSNRTGETDFIEDPMVGPIFYPSNSLTVQYGGDFSADFLITNYLKGKDFPPRTRVVSSDKELIKMAHRNKAVSIKSETFATEVLEELEEQALGVQEQTNFDGMTTENWLDLFKKPPKE